MNDTLPLKDMSVSDKLQTMEVFGADLSNRDFGYTPLEWHNEILKERKRELTLDHQGNVLMSVLPSNTRFVPVWTSINSKLVFMNTPRNSLSPVAP